jgi:hypothetical protein
MMLQPRDAYKNVRRHEAGRLVAPGEGLARVLCIMKSVHAYPWHACVAMKSLSPSRDACNELKRTYVCVAITAAIVMAASMPQHPEISS